ncbi:MAG: hypothetical protein R3B39_01310 [Candidatus Paceibacterota bacterium]
MFEKLFGKKLNNIKGKDSIQPSVNGFAHFDGTKKEEDLFDDRYEVEQAKFDKKRVDELKEKGKRNWYWQDEQNSKVGNERTHPKLGDKKSGLGRENLVEDPESKWETSMNILEDARKHNEDRGDDFEEDDFENDNRRAA